MVAKKTNVCVVLFLFCLSSTQFIKHNAILCHVLMWYKMLLNGVSVFLVKSQVNWCWVKVDRSVILYYLIIAINQSFLKVYFQTGWCQLLSLNGSVIMMSLSCFSSPNFVDEKSDKLEPQVNVPTFYCRLYCIVATGSQINGSPSESADFLL